jgi:hypothetical protein
MGQVMQLVGCNDCQYHRFRVHNRAWQKLTFASAVPEEILTLGDIYSHSGKRRDKKNQRLTLFQDIPFDP